MREIVPCPGFLHVNDRGELKFPDRELRRLSSKDYRKLCLLTWMHCLDL